jgi:hypothetical protein
MAPLSVDCVKAFSGQAATQGASLQALHVIATLESWLSLTARMRDFTGLKAFSFSQEQMYSQMSQPTHFCGSQSTNWLTMFKA